ncbi:MAG: rhodanese-like domain-containing protein [Pseudomonadota bacterium]
MILSVEQMVGEAKTRIREVDTEMALRMIAEDAVVLDVREPPEYAAGTLPRAVNIPRGVLEFKVDDHPALTRRENPILVYCAGGGRSALAARTLQDMGFGQVASLAGGFDAWSAKALPVVRGTAR